MVSPVSLFFVELIEHLDIRGISHYLCVEIAVDDSCRKQCHCTSDDDGYLYSDFAISVYFHSKRVEDKELQNSNWWHKSSRSDAFISDSC